METQKVAELNERHRERQLQRDTAHAERALHSEHTESLDYFLESFGQQATDIAANIANLDHPDRHTLAVRCDRIAKSVQQLQLYLSASTLFLPDSVVKRNQRTIAELTGQLDAVKAKLLPKKKFGFRAAKAATTPTAVAAAPAAVAGDETVASPACDLDWTCKDRHGVEIVLEDDQVNGMDITMSTLSRCLIRIRGHPGSLQLSNVRDCLVLCGPVARSVFVDNCERTVLAFGCQQFRLHTSSRCTIYMHVTCRAIIEDCTEIAVAPCTYAYAGSELDYAKAALSVTQNNWQDVADFNWLAADRVSPNWRRLPDAEWERDWARRADEFRAEVLLLLAGRDEGEV